jgi:hypothetical protein
MNTLKIKVLKCALALCALAWLAPESAHAQRTERIQYFTDSKVNKNPISLGINYSPYFASRRELEDEFEANFVYTPTEAAAKLRFGQSFGADLYIDLGQSFDVALGFNRSTSAFAVELGSYYDENLFDTVRGNFLLTSRLTHFNIPIHIILKADLSDYFALEFLPQIEFNIPQFYQQEVTAPGSETILSERNLLQLSRSYTTTVGMAVGGNYRFVDNVSWFLRANFRYMLTPLVQSEGMPREVMYTFGLYTGFRFYF